MKSRRQGFLNQTSLDERAVQAVARGDAGASRHRRRGRSRREPSTRVKVGHMFDGLEDTVVEELVRIGIQPAHVQVVNPTTAIIWNHAAPWPGSDSEQEAQS